MSGDDYLDQAYHLCGFLTREFSNADGCGVASTEVYGCGRCGALVDDDREQHEVFHSSRVVVPRKEETR